MNARIYLTLTTRTAEEAQRLLKTLGEGLLLSGSIGDYRFEIEAGEGMVTEKCIISEGKVVA